MSPAGPTTVEVLVAVDDAGAVVGAVLFVLPGSRYAAALRPREAEFRMLAVLPAAQGKGVGQALVEACRALAAGAGASAIIICVRVTPPMRRSACTQRLGFVRVPDRDWSPMPGVDLLALRLELGRRDPGSA